MDLTKGDLTCAIANGTAIVQSALHLVLSLHSFYELMIFRRQP